MTAVHEIESPDLEAAAKALAELADRFGSDTTMVASINAHSGIAHSLLLYVRNDPGMVKAITRAIKRYEQRK